MAPSIFPKLSKSTQNSNLSRQFWAYLVNKKAIKDPQLFIHSVPAFQFCPAAPLTQRFSKNASKRSARIIATTGMEFSNDKKQIEEWIPLVMEGRDSTEMVAATRMITGTDVDYGALHQPSD